MFLTPTQAKFDKIKIHLSQVSEEFLNLFPDDIKVKLIEGFYIAGGCIYSLYNDKKPNDYDIFLYSKSTGNILSAFFMQYINQFKHGGISLGNYNGLQIVKTKNAISIGDKFQVILKYAGMPYSVIEAFDFKHNMFYYMPEIDMVDCHPDVDFSYLTTNDMYFNDLRARDLCGVILRLPKFLERGMRINKKEIAKILTKLQGCINDENEKDILLDYTSTQGY
jgi:hypothetical protein